MKYDIRKVVSYVILDEDGDIVNEFADYEDAYRQMREMELSDSEVQNG